MLKKFKRLKRKIRDFFIDRFGKKWPAGCGYQGYEFGGGYLDSECFGGKLFDMDNFSDGLLYAPSEDIPCPMCRRNDAIMFWAERNADCDEPTAENFANAVSLVDDIRRNRGVLPYGEKE